MRTKAIILKKQSAGEYDQLITCYTEEFGKLTAVAKSALKPNSIQAMHLDIFNMVDFELINGRATPIIAGAQAERVYRNIKDNLPALAGAYFFSEVFDRLVFDYQKDDGMWDFLSNLMEDLDNGEEDFKELFRKKQAGLINLLGYAPNMNECISCSNHNIPELIAYSTDSRGMVCKNCFFEGQGGMVIKDGESLSISVMNAIFESLAERKLHSLNFMKNVVK